MPQRPLLDALAFSSLLAAGVGGALGLAVGEALASPTPFRDAALIGTGAFIIYTLDRLRDTRRDRTTSPDRTAFVERHRGRLTLALAAAAIGFGGLLFAAPRDVALLCVAIGTIGLFHRRLKRGAALKALYVSVAWSLACVGVPWLSAGRPSTGGVTAAILFPPLLANLVASNLRDGEGELLRHRPATLLTITRAIALAGVAAAALAPPTLRPLAWIAVAEWAALLGFRKDERYGLVVIDGALFVGAIAAIGHLAAQRAG